MGPSWVGRPHGTWVRGETTLGLGAWGNHLGSGCMGGGGNMRPGGKTISSLSLLTPSACLSVHL